MDNDKYRELLRQDYSFNIERLEILKDLCKEHHIKLSDLLMAQMVQKVEDIKNVLEYQMEEMNKYR